jgi:hypothetical protein
MWHLAEHVGLLQATQTVGSLPSTQFLPQPAHKTSGQLKEVLHPELNWSKGPEGLDLGDSPD